MYCPKCRGSIDNDSKFCTSCGYKIKENLIKYNKNSLQENQLQMQAIQLKMQQQQLRLQAQQLQVQQAQYNSMLKCPHCGSTSISGNKKGYGVVKGALGASIGSIVPGVGTIIGLAAGNIGRKKIICTCMNCGKKFKAGKK